MRHRLWLLVVLLALLPGCTREVFHRDGAGCDEEGHCPPGEVCSARGTCLFPCPVADCTGDQCGCDGVTRYEPQWPRACLADGLCHRLCQPDSSCYAGTQCDPSLGVCAWRCGGGGLGFCPAGTSCAEPEMGDSFCRGDATSL